MKTHLVKIFVSFLMAFAFGCGGSTSNKKSSIVTETPGKNMLSVKSMHDDLSVLWSVIKELHPILKWITVQKMWYAITIWI
ncbi:MULTISPECIES: hypothetical protein [unclassified Pedobacter]|uniref:hypothetical protein n=1 Tax=unclassified Pedobacter TaxID=2628915 RepID=UPI00141DDF01|nr:MULTISPECIES: hypothetical protein [unclassified Pedobacter]NII81250.1 hypothetical protein [Pedobacter sp. SG908]NMN35256.1 hypothetical protein [Pedobacter sp. SG918]